MRYTIDGSPELEKRLNQVCERIRSAIQNLAFARRIEALVLGGGYGRGEGGVLRTSTGDQPYNDMEFYLFLRGNRLWNERRYGPELHCFADAFTKELGLHVEFKVDSLVRWRSSPVSMYSYDLVAGHKVLLGKLSPFIGCSHHLNARAIPLSEGIRLLVNRCSGLLLVRERLCNAQLSVEDADFIGRNLAKAKLAFGDAILTAYRQYHWSCRERQNRLKNLCPALHSIDAKEILRLHMEGVEFKLHPVRIKKHADEFLAEHRRLLTSARQVWLWLENIRLGSRFSSLEEYACSDLQKCAGSPAWLNYLLNFRAFGWKAVFDSWAWRYPRERLMAALPLLMEEDGAAGNASTRRLQSALLSPSSDWAGLVSAYKNLWPAFG